MKTLNLKKTDLMFETFFASIFDIRNNPLIKHIIINKWLYKILLILVLLIIITIFIRNYTIYIASLKYKKFKEEKQERIDKFTEEFKNINIDEQEEGFETAQIQQLWENLWQTNTTPFSFNNAFQKSFGYLYDNDDIIEGFNPLKGSDWRGLFDQIDNMFNNVKDAFNQILVVKDIINGIITAINDARRRFIYLGNGIADLFTAFGYSMKTMFYDGVPTIGNDLVSIIYGGGKCMVHFGSNFRSCLIFWIMDLVSEVLYSLLVLIPVYIFDAIFPSLKLNSWIDEIKSWIDYVDELLINMLGYSCFHYPDSIINDCYECRGVDFPRKVRELQEDSTRLNKALDKLGYDYKNAFYQIGRAFS